MLTFGDPESIRRRAEEHSEERARQDADFSRAAWLAFAGLDERGNLIKPLKTRLPPGANPANTCTGPETADFSPSRPDPGAGSVPMPFTPPKAATGPKNARKTVRMFGKNR